MRLPAAVLGVPLTTGQLVTKGVSTPSQYDAWRAPTNSERRP